MFFLVVILGSIEGDAGHRANGMADLVLAHGEHGVIKVGAPAAQGMEGPPVNGGDCAVRLVDMSHIFRPLFADKTKIAARDHSPLAVNHAHDPVCGFLNLQDNVLKNSS